MKEKLLIWIGLFLLGGIGYLCYRASDYFLHRSQSTLSRWTDLDCQLDCKVLVGSFVDGIGPELPSPEPGGSLRWRNLSDYKDGDVSITSTQVQAPAFLQARIKKVTVEGFSGLAPPRVLMVLALRPANHAALQPGRWPLQLRGSASLKAPYWKRQLKPAQQELAQLRLSGSPDQQERARLRLNNLLQKARLLSQPHPLSGHGSVTVESLSNLGGLVERGVGWLFGALALLFLGAAVLLSTLYLITLTAGDVEP